MTGNSADTEQKTMKTKDHEEIEAFALVAWVAMNADQRHGCKFGLFPFEIMQAAERRGLDTQACAVALMKKAAGEHVKVQ